MPDASAPRGVPAHLVLKELAKRAGVTGRGGGILAEYSGYTPQQIRRVFQGTATRSETAHVYSCIMGLDYDRGGALGHEISSKEAQMVGEALGLSWQVVRPRVEQRTVSEAQVKERTLLRIGRELKSLRDFDETQYRHAVRELGLTREQGGRAIDRFERTRAGELAPAAFEKKCRCGKTFIDYGGPRALRELCAACVAEAPGGQREGAAA